MRSTERDPRDEMRGRIDTVGEVTERRWPRRMPGLFVAVPKSARLEWLYVIALVISVCRRAGGLTGPAYISSAVGY